MLIRLSGGRVIDPANRRDEIGDLWIRERRIVDAAARRTPDANPRRLRQDRHGRRHRHPFPYRRRQCEYGAAAAARKASRRWPRPAETPLSTAKWSTFETGCLYAAMGFTTVVEPAVPPHQALHAHLELADIPIIDKGMLTVLGNDDFLLSLMRDGGKDRAAIADYVASTLAATKGLGVKCINAGGVGGIQIQCADLRSRRCRALLRCHLAADRRGAAAGVIDIDIAASAASALQQSRHPRQCRDRARDDRGGATASRCISPICNSTPMARRASTAFLPPRRGSPRRSSGAERHRRRRPGDVPPDGDDLVRRAAPVQRDRQGQAEENR